MINNDAYEDIRNYISDKGVFIFGKGDKKNHHCRFTYYVVSLLDEMNIHFEYVNVLSQKNLRQRVKEFTKWPTFPQIFYNGSLIGGADVIQDLYEKDKLRNILTGKESVD